jgi:hypothetical protein
MYIGDNSYQLFFLQDTDIYSISNTLFSNQEHKALMMNPNNTLTPNFSLFTLTSKVSNLCNLNFCRTQVNNQWFETQTTTDY